MERSFDDCKRLLERECVVEEGLFAESLVRLREFMLPFVASFSRRLQREHFSQCCQQRARAKSRVC